MKKKKSIPKPLEAIEGITYNYPDIWENVKADDFTSVKKYCNDHDISNSLCLVLGLLKWKQSKQIFEINEELCEILMQTDKLDEEIPIEVIENLMFDCFYVKLPDKYINITNLVNDDGSQGNFSIDGFFYFVDSDLSANIKSVIIVFMFSSGHSQSIGFDVKNGLSLRECIDCHMKASPDVYTIINFFMQIVLYMSACNADIEQDREQEEIRERAEKKALEKGKTEQGSTEQSKRQEIKYSDLQKWNVGYRYGAAVKKARQAERKEQNNKRSDTAEHIRQGSHSRKRTHARRGHFHHFWTGSRTGERQLIVKWVSPIIVNAEYENIVTIRKLK